MSDFCQNSTKVTTLHLLKEDSGQMRGLLKVNSLEKKPVLIVPCLAREFTAPDRAEVFANILKELAKIDYLEEIIFGLDKADESEYRLLLDLVDEAGLKNALVQWNDGPDWQPIYHKLGEAGLDLSQPGKGRNMFLSFGIALALGARVVGIVDADIKTFAREQVDRLFFPLVVLDYDFAKAYYARLHQNKLYGRVKRLLLDPLLIALKRKFSDSSADKFLRIIDFLLAFRYQLSGEAAFRSDFLRKTRVATNWGVEIYTLMEAYRKASGICQVEFTPAFFDHKHQEEGGAQPQGALQHMATDIITTLMNSLMVEEGLEITPTFFRDLAVTYQSVAEQLIKKYRHESLFNNLDYDRDEEERLVRQIFRPALVATGEQLASQSRLAEMFLFFVNSHPEFGEFMDQGLARAINQVANKGETGLFEVPQTPSWERACDKIPGIFQELRTLAGR